MMIYCRYISISHTSIEEMISTGNGSLSRLFYAYESTSAVSSFRASLLVFWIPLSWFECCDIYYSIKPFVTKLLSLLSINIPHKPKGNLTTIDIELLYQRINLAKTSLLDDKNEKMKQEFKNKEQLSVLLEAMDKMFNMMKTIEPFLSRLNNFINYYCSIFSYGMYHVLVFYRRS